MGDGVPWAAVVPALIAAAGFVAYCIVDITRSSVRHLPKWVWIAFTCISVPIGGILYLLWGRGGLRGGSANSAVNG